MTKSNQESKSTSESSEYQDAVNVSRDLLREIQLSKGLYRDVVNHTHIFNAAQKIIAFQSFLIGPISDLEQSYRRIVTSCIADGMSNAASDAHAKASDDYKAWRKIERVYSLADEQIKLLKKFSDKMSTDYQNSNA